MVAHLLFHISRRLAVLKHERGVGMAQVMDAEGAELRGPPQGIKLPRAEVEFVQEIPFVVTEDPFRNRDPFFSHCSLR